jgi:formylglycine-generating enzyme required for sulfatase activity
MCRTETRVKDFRAYANDTDYVQRGSAYVLKVKGDAKSGYSAAWEADPAASWEKPGFTQGAEHPVVCVSLEEAEAFCAWLSRKEGKTYRLPTDAEWSAAVGVGKYPWGSSDTPPEGSGNYAGTEWAETMPGKGWPTAYARDDGHARTATVASFAESKNGFFDLGGNVWEWCSDRYKASMNEAEALAAYPVLKNEKAIDGMPYRVLRGGSWRNYVSMALRSSSRNNVQPANRNDYNGFRVVVVSGR